MTENTLHAIIADDDNIIRETLTIIIETIIPGIEIDAVTNGKDLAEKVINGNYAFAITDNSMPGGNGIEAIAEIRKHNPKIPILMTSGDSEHGGKKIEERAREAGATDYLPKPYSNKDLEIILIKYQEMVNI